MALITIAGTELNPSEYVVNIYDLQQAYRDANGDMQFEVKRNRKRKIEMTFNYLTSANLAIMLNLVSNQTFSVTYQDPMIGGVRTSTFYVGDRNCPMMKFQDGIPYYVGIKMNLIEV